MSQHGDYSEDEDVHQDERGRYLEKENGRPPKQSRPRSKSSKTDRSRSHSSSQSSRSHKSRSQSSSRSRSRSSSPESTRVGPSEKYIQVLRENASKHRHARRLENAADMGRDTATAEARAKRAAERAAEAEQKKKEKEERARRRQQEQLDKIAEELRKVQEENAALKRGQSQAMSSASKRKTKKPRYTVKIPVNQEENVVEFAKTELWRDCKFISGPNDMFTVSWKIMGKLAVFQPLVADSVLMDQKTENINAFSQMYGKVICKAINQKRTDCQGSLKKAYEKRYCEGLPMPTPQELVEVIRRTKDMMPQKPKDGETLSADDQKALDKSNKEAARLRDFFQWYWECLLPCVTGKFRWGYNIRNHCTISSGMMPGEADLKYITSTDEGLVAAIYENCSQRFPYTAECAKNRTKVDKKSALYTTMWCDEAAGQLQFGGWTTDGRNRFIALRQAIIVGKKQDHVAELEKLILKKIRKAKKLDVASAPTVAQEDFVGAKACFLDQNSDDEGDAQVNLQPFVPKYRPVKTEKKTTKRKKAGLKTTGEEEPEEESSESEDDDPQEDDKEGGSDEGEDGDDEE